MRLHTYTNPRQGSTYEDLLTTAGAADDLGFDGFFPAPAEIGPRRERLRAACVEAGGDDAGGLGTSWMTRNGLFAAEGISRLCVRTPQQFDIDHLEYFSRQTAHQLDASAR
ncbi:hypothetical protein QR77_40195 [Streptomyces sp. 150FB]|uniref:hypothetical protein n=1 Tax=Streptomyces sp. 150FB TaxID=1576605 RepID=UPI0005891FC3|nr:hypothetical protein [Streptomyces sp. 150FB]KIF78322.1 hypothetical protein QR77_40195 [Streptomyces sp. 150FB]